jgi:outer membrane protein assembly factor BamB/DNA-directed RNA polymerase subunit RPC12/RpoP
MPIAVPVRCPQCGADLRVSSTDENVTCSYCGTTSFLQKRGVTAPPNMSVIVVSKGPSAVLVVALVAVALGAVVTALLIVHQGARPTPPGYTRPVSVPTPPPKPVAPPPSPEPPRPEVERLRTSRRPLIVDVDGDGKLDVIALADLRDGARGGSAFVALEGQTGKRLWQIGADDRGTDEYVAVAGGRLFVLGGSGQVQGYDLVTAARQWSTALGDKGHRFCAAREPDSVLVAVADGRVLALDVKTGRQTPSSTRTCASLPTDEDPDNEDPRDRTDPQAPVGTVGISCGGVTVMGDQNYTVPDACAVRAHVDSAHLGGMVAHALWQLPGGNWLAYGVRDPGTHSPLVGVLQKRKLLWKADVPPGNPLDAQDGGPHPIVLADDRVVAGYALKNDGSTRLAAFALSNGKRLWDVTIAGKRVERAVWAGGELYLYRDGRIEVRDPATGSLRRTLP